VHRFTDINLLSAFNCHGEFRDYNKALSFRPRFADLANRKPERGNFPASVFQKMKTKFISHLFTFLFLLLVSGPILYLWMVSPDLTRLCCYISVILLSFILMSFTARLCLFDLVVSENKLSLICLTFTDTSKQLHFTLFFMFTSFRTNSYLSSSSHCFYGAWLSVDKPSRPTPCKQTVQSNARRKEQLTSHVHSSQFQTGKDAPLAADSEDFQTTSCVNYSFNYICHRVRSINLS
jgi:hypothetical protein